MSEIICSLCEVDLAIVSINILSSDEEHYLCKGCVKFVLRHALQHSEIDEIFDIAEKYRISTGN